MHIIELTTKLHIINTEWYKISIIYTTYINYQFFINW